MQELFASHVRLLASGSLDGSVMLWEPKTRACLRMLRPDRRYERMELPGSRATRTRRHSSPRAPSNNPNSQTLGAFAGVSSVTRSCGNA